MANWNVISIGLIGNLWNPATNATVNVTSVTLTTNSYSSSTKFVQRIWQDGGVWDDFGRWISRSAIGIITIA